MESLNKHFSALTKAAFQRHGFASEQLAAQWAVIVGPRLAAVTSPEKIKWPQIAQSQSQKLGGTLVIRAQAGRALDVHYEITRIIEKVNQFLGYGAISAVKVLATADVPPPSTQTKRPPRPETLDAWAGIMTGIADDKLKAALARLGAELSPKGPTHSPFSTGEIRGFDQPPNSSRKLT
jgi:hypothetical protein